MPGAGRPLMYPENLTAGNLAYFMAAPTLCYQMSYPRSSRFRLRWTLWYMPALCLLPGMPTECACFLPGFCRVSGPVPPSSHLLCLPAGMPMICMCFLPNFIKVWRPNHLSNYLRCRLLVHLSALSVTWAMSTKSATHMLSLLQE